MAVKKIFYLGDFKRIWNEEGIARAIERNGIQVIRYPEQNFWHMDAVEILRKENPDIFLFAKMKIPTNNEKIVLLKEAKRLGIKTVCWLWDLFFGLKRERELKINPIFKADLVLSPDGGHDKEFKELGINHKVLRQAIPDEYCFLGEKKPEYSFDVTFTGSFNPQFLYREEMCEFLEENYNFRRFGLKDDIVRGDNLNYLYRSSKIVIGDSFPSPYYWSNRLCETLGRGGFCLFTKIIGLEEDYVPYKHFIPFGTNNFRGLKEKIDYFLNKPKEREKIVMAGFEHVKKNHTLTSRVKKLLELCYA